MDFVIGFDNPPGGRAVRAIVAGEGLSCGGDGMLQVLETGIGLGVDELLASSHSGS